MIPELDLTPETQILKETVAKFAREVIEPRAQELWDSGDFPLEIMSQMAELGYMGIHAGTESGGGGADTVTYAVFLEELAYADMAIALTLQVHVLVTDLFERFGSEAQKEEWLPRLTSGQILAAVAMTEPNAGSDLSSCQTRAELQNGKWVINGSKIFITNAGTEMSDGLVVLARTGERELSTFIVPRNTPGFVVGQKLRKLGWHSMDTRELFFDNCTVPEENLLGPRGKGLRHVLTGMDLGRIAFAACSTGLAQACLDESLEYAKNRVQFGAPIASFQGIQFKLADMATKIAASRSLTHRAARLRDAEMTVDMASSQAKLYATRACVEVVDDAFQIFGGYGFMLEYPIARRYADAKIMEIGEGTNEIQRIVIARGLGCPSGR